MIYCMSDLHGCYNAYLSMLEQIGFSDRDTLYILGDVIDRGPQSIRILQDMMMRANVFPILGNHEYAAITCLKFLLKEVTKKSTEEIDAEELLAVEEWLRIGGQDTLDELKKLSREEREDLLDYLLEFSLYAELTVNGQEYVLVHGGLSGFYPERPMDEYLVPELIFGHPDYSRRYFPNKYLVTGHYPTTLIPGHEKDEVYQKNGHFAIDCGCVFGGRLACLRLDDQKIFYEQWVPR